jgi:1-acyl-sn-glycerol-3-phosphate acyltransferase
MVWYKLLLGRVFALYAIIIFVLTMMPALIVLLIGHAYKKNIQKDIHTHTVFRYWMAIYMPLIGCSVKKVGTEHFKKNKNYIVVLNHNSLMDIPVSSPGIPVPNKTLGKSSFSKAPLFGYMYKAGSILIDRKSARSKAESYIAMKQVLKSGLSICLYPEGTRNKSEHKLLTFQPGAFKLALDTGVDIIPGIITNTKKILPADGPVFWAWPHVIYFTFLQPIAISNYAKQEVEKLSTHCRERMMEVLDK